MPTVSILIPYFNDKQYLATAIESVLNQTYTDFELILLNHASTDGSDKVAHTYDDRRIRHITMPRNEGAGGGLIFSKFMEEAQGEYIKTFCADDILFPDCLENCLNFIQKNVSADFIFGNITFIDEKGIDLNDNWFKSRCNFDINDTQNELLTKFLRGSSILPFIGAFFKKSAMQDFTFDTSIVMLFDMSLWVQGLLKKKNFIFYDEPIAYYRIHDGQVSSLKNMAKIQHTFFYERCVYAQYCFEIKSYSDLKNFCSSSPYIDKVEPHEIHLFPFVIACYLFSQDSRDANSIVSYIRINQMLNDQTLAQEIYSKFNFGVKEFREMYSTVSIKKLKKNKKNFLKKYKDTLYNTEIKKLSLQQLLFLTSRKILLIIPHLLRKLKPHKGKNYSA